MQKNYYAIIPANVRYDKELTPNAKLLYGEITALCNEKGYCWASNSYFSDLYGVSKVSVSKWINQLVSKGYLNSDVQYKEGTKEILNRYLRIVNDPIKEKLNTPIKEKFKDNITSFNTTSNNTKDIYTPIFDKWVSVGIIKHKKLTSNMKAKIKKALKDYEEEDILKAIENYDYVLNSDNHYWTHKWGLEDFLSRGLKTFVDEAEPLTNYLSVKQKGGVITGSSQQNDQYANLF